MEYRKIMDSKRKPMKPSINKDKIVNFETTKGQRSQNHILIMLEILLNISIRKCAIILFAIGLLGNIAVAADVRQRININREWKFKLGDATDARQSEYDDSGWQHVGLPHSFSIPYFLSKDFYVGYGWYRKTLDIPGDYLGKKIGIEFEAVFQYAEIFVNGKKAGEHKGGYTGFTVDLTSYVKAGRNAISVRVNNLWNPRLAPRSGEHVFSGGIYRDVYLTVTNPTHVAWYGTFVTTPVVSKESATINVKTEIQNQNNTEKNIRLVSKIYAPDGNLVLSLANEKRIRPNSPDSFDQTFRPLPSPMLWSFDSPNIYKVISEVFEGKKLVDVYETMFGIRKVEWTADKGFFLNGEHVYLRGTNAHQDHAGWGDAVTNAGIRRDVQMVKDAGFNFVRGSHYPHDPAFSEACDEIGVLFWPENAIWGTGGFSSSDGYWNSSAYPIFEEDRAGFEASAKQQLGELIRIHRNHPSIIIWSMSNEPFFTAPATLENMKMLLRKTVELSHLLDPTRLAAIGGAQRPLGDARIDKLGDAAGYNGDGGVLPDFQNPGIPNMVSEYGSVTADRPGNYAPGWGDLAKNDSYKGYTWRSGQAIWCAFDHGSIAGSALGKMGIVDYFRIPKRAWYWYRNEYKGIAPPEWPKEGVPSKIKLEADKTNGIKTDGTDDVKLLVTILNADGKHINNSPTVKLEVVSGPGEFPTGKSITFDKSSDIRIADGLAAIEFRSYYAGTTIIRATSEGLPPVELKLQFAGGSKYVKAITSETIDRPYTRFSSEGKDNIPQLFGRNNPTFPSSSSEDHTGGKAADGDRNTFWQPTSGDKNAYWILDTERELSITEIRIYFAESATYSYVIEISKDKENWSIVSDLSSNTKSEKEKKLILPNNLRGRFIRVRFNNILHVIPQLSEVEVIGKVNQ